MSQKALVKNVGEVVKNETTLKVVETPKATENEKNVVVSATTNPAQEQIKKNATIQTAEQRLKSVEQFQILGDKFRFLKKKEDELNKFILSSDGTKEKISLSNASGFSFEVSNSQTIEKVLKIITDDLEIFTARAEQEIMQFTV
jgi:hypothetical protein